MPQKGTLAAPEYLRFAERGWCYWESRQRGSRSRGKAKVWTEFCGGARRRGTAQRTELEVRCDWNRSGDRKSEHPTFRGPKRVETQRCSKNLKRFLRWSQTERNCTQHCELEQPGVTDTRPVAESQNILHFLHQSLVTVSCVTVCICSWFEAWTKVLSD